MMNLYEKNPDIAKPYMERMASNLDLAVRGRVKESAGFKIRDIQKKWKPWTKRRTRVA